MGALRWTGSHPLGMTGEGGLGEGGSGENASGDRVAVLSAAAAGLVLAHVMIDQHIGLWGVTSEQMSLLQAANVAGHGLLFAWWMVLIAWARAPARPGATMALTLMVGLEALLFNGLVALAACPPPCAGAFPYQDIVHLAIVGVGGWAGLTAYRAWQTRHRGEGRRLTWLTVAVIVASMALSAPLSIQVLSGG